MSTEEWAKARALTVTGMWEGKINTNLEMWEWDELVEAVAAALREVAGDDLKNILADKEGQLMDLYAQLDQARAEVERMYNLAGEDSEGKTQRDYHELESQLAQARDDAQRYAQNVEHAHNLIADLRQQLAVRERELAEAREQMQRACDGGDVFFLEQWLAAHPELPK
jgi:chromosome segregation ATPase